MDIVCIKKVCFKVIRYSVTIAEYFYVLSTYCYVTNLQPKTSHQSVIPSSYTYFHFGRTRKHYLLGIFLKIYLNKILNHSISWWKSQCPPLGGRSLQLSAGGDIFGSLMLSCTYMENPCVMGLYQMSLVDPFSKCSRPPECQVAPLLLGQTWVFR